MGKNSKISEIQKSCSKGMHWFDGISVFTWMILKFYRNKKNLNTYEYP